MGPKAAKKDSDKKPNTAGDSAGKAEAGLITAPFEEDSWRACVSLVVERSPEEEKLVQALASAVQQPQRRLFTLLTWDNLIAKIHELGNPKAKKPDGTPMFFEAIEHAKTLLDAGEKIPCDLMAKAIKFELLQIKANDQKQREIEQAEREKSKEPPSYNSKDKGGAKDKKGKGPPSPVVSSKEKKTQLKRRDDVEPPKFIDDEPDSGPQLYILLVGFYQPHLIGLLDAIGVHVANVIKLCLEHTNSTEGQQEQPCCEDIKESLRATPVVDAEANFHGSEELALQATKLDLFWSGLKPVLDGGPPDSKLHDVVQLSYTIPDHFQAQDPESMLELGSRIFDGVAKLIYDCLGWRQQHQHYKDNVKLITIPTVDVLDSRPAKVVATETATPQLKNVDMCYYSHLLDQVPCEACSVPLVLHCMLEQVVISEELSGAERSLPTHTALNDDTKPLCGPWLDSELASYMLQRFFSLVHTNNDRSQMLSEILPTVQNEEDKKRLAEKFGGQALKNPKDPLVIRHLDERALRLRDITVVSHFNPAEVELSIIRLTPVWELIQSVAQKSNKNSSWMTLKQQLQHYCTDDFVSWPEVERLFHQSVFESMPLTRLDDEGVLPRAAKTQEPTWQQTPTVIPWDNPWSYSKQQLHDLQHTGIFPMEDPEQTEHCSGRVRCQLDLAGIQSCRQRSLLDWHYAEHHNAAVFPQVLQLASEEYLCMDTFRGTHNNILYIFCHNPMSPQCQSKEFWDVALHTDVKFRTYLEHVADKISDWTREEELKRVATFSVEEVKEMEEKEEVEKNGEGEENILESVIRKDSLKAWKLEQERSKEEEMAKKSKKENTPKGKQQKEEKSKTLSSGKTSKPETAASRANTPTTSTITAAPPVDKSQELHTTEEPFNGFTGYNMDGKLIHASGRLQYLFPSDGGQITVENISFVAGSSHMKLSVKKDGHNFYTHINEVLADPAKPPPQTQDTKTTDPKEDYKERLSKSVETKRVKQGSFSAVLANKIHLSYSFFGPTGEYTVSTQETKVGIQEPSAVDSVPLLSSTHKSSQLCSSLNTFNSLCLSVPNGLLLQFLQDDTQGVSPEERDLLVRQSFPFYSSGKVSHQRDISLSRELSRVITSQGAVIRHMRDRSTEVLFPDGSVSFSQDSGPVWVPDSEVQEDNPHREAEHNKKEHSSGCWITTSPSGDRICTVGTTHRIIPMDSLHCFKATDLITHQVMCSREDLVVSVQNPDGSLIVEYADGTRITSLFQDKPINTAQHKGMRPEYTNLKSASRCVTCCVDSINENMETQSACDNREEISRNSEGTPHTCNKNECGFMCNDRECTQSGMHLNSEQKEFTVIENGKASDCEIDNGTVSAKESVVLVEKEGFATVVMYPERHAAHVFLADGTVISGTNQGEYEVFPPSVGLLQIQNDGKCLYSSDPSVTPSPKGYASLNQPGIYAMSHTDKIACDMTDPDGNHFQVMEDGQITILNSSPAPSSFKHDEEILEEEKNKEVAILHVKHMEHRPRLFLVHEDSSGTELLNYHTVEELLYQVYSDPTIALMKEQLPDTQDEFGITILKPSHQSVWSQWLLGKQNPDITPPNLRYRSRHDFPRAETKSQGPPFGTDKGSGLTLKVQTRASAVQHQPVRSCPKVLEMRELYQHRPFTTPLRNTIDSRLKQYIESLMERELQLEERKVKDPCSEEDGDLLKLILSFAGGDESSQTISLWTSESTVDVASLYNQGVKDPTEQSDISEDTAASDDMEKFKWFPKGKDSKWTERREQYREELCEEKTWREALRKKSSVPFFHPENISLYQGLLPHEIPDMRMLSMDLPPIPKSDSAEAFLKDAPQEDTPRPLNPTPSKSESHAPACDRNPEKRPTNPTPQTAGECSLRGLSRQCKPVQLDVTGKPRRSRVKKPTSILGSKPCSVPNQQFLTVEEPVRRTCRTVSLTDPSVVARGFQFLPPSVDFGTVQEGTTSAITVVMKNVGVDMCRFHVKQPPAATGLRVIYNPGPVAAGLKVKLQVQLFAMCVPRAGEEEPKKYLSQDIIIHTEPEIIYLPVTATIVPERLHAVWLKEHNSAHKKKESRVLRPSTGFGNNAQKNHD
ncbi:sperm-associated antigen 17 [Parambassis ranga]|uniref:Sperm-associated antigen 17 n=1 Tax=Parambassis ranga TaxID=210632 RepID=A0A6P7K7A5_9TELE|nr:sperm-associated antigen 17 [Parambassis ranga]